MNLAPRLRAMACLFILSCKGDKESSSTDDKSRAQAKELARKFILVATRRVDEWSDSS